MKHFKSLRAMSSYPVIGQDDDGKSKSIASLGTEELTFIVAIIQAVDAKKERAEES